MNAVCIKCWDEDAVVVLHLDGSETFECQGCGETFTCEDVRAMLEAAAKWRKVLAWVEAAPVEEEETAA